MSNVISLSLVANLRYVLFGVCLTDRALKFKFKPSNKARVFVEVMTTRKLCERVCQFEVVHADGATGMALRGDVVHVGLVHGLKLSVVKRLTDRCSLDNLTVFDVSSLTFLEAPDSDALSKNLEECAQDDGQDHHPEEHNEKVEK